MKPEKTKEAFIKCLEQLKRSYPYCTALELSASQKADPMSNHRGPGLTNMIQHFMWMALAGCGLVDEGRLDKANRWLGFLQGGMWMDGMTSIDQMKDWNRPERDTVEQVMKDVVSDLKIEPTRKRMILVTGRSCGKSTDVGAQSILEAEDARMLERLAADMQKMEATPPFQEMADACAITPNHLGYKCIYTRDENARPVQLVGWQRINDQSIRYATATVHQPGTKLEELGHGLLRRVRINDRFDKRRAHSLVRRRLNQINQYKVIACATGQAEASHVLINISLTHWNDRVTKAALLRLGQLGDRAKEGWK